MVDWLLNVFYLYSRTLSPKAWPPLCQHIASDIGHKFNTHVKTECRPQEHPRWPHTSVPSASPTHDSKTSSATPATLMLQQSASLVQPQDYRHHIKSAPFCPSRTSWIQFTPPHVCLMRSFLILWPHSLFGSDYWIALVLLAADKGLCSTHLPILLTGHDLSYTTKANLWYGRQPQMIN